jgi:competence protein ComEC
MLINSIKQLLLFSLSVALTHRLYGIKFFSLVLSLWLIILSIIWIFNLKIKKHFFISSITISIGLLISVVQINNIKYNLNSINIDNNIKKIVGTIVDLPINKQNYAKIKLAPQRDNLQLPGDILLTWSNPPEITPGETWEINCKLRRVHNFSSYNSFDAEAFYIRQNIYLRGTVKQAKKIADSPKFSQIIAKIRLKLKTELENIVNNQDTSSILTALLVGDKSNIQQDLWDKLNASGTTHLVVVSGLHIGLIIVLGLLLAKILAFSRILPLRKITRPLISSIISLLLAIVYSVIAGFSIPIQRALIMSSVVLLPPFLGIKIKKVTQLLLAITIVHLIDPLCSLSQSFWLSFVAVSCLMFSTHAVNSRHSQLIKYIQPQIVIFCIMAPILAYTGKSLSLIAPVVNLIAIPLIGFLVVPLLLTWGIVNIIFAKSITWLLWLPIKSLSLFIYILSLLQKTNIFTIKLSFPTEISAILAIIAAFFVITPNALLLKRFALFLILPALFPQTVTLKDSIAEISILDVGQGLSVIIKTKSHALVYDTGDKFPSGFSLANQVVIPALYHHGISKLDKIIISHADRDHAGGLVDLLSEFPADVVSSSKLDISQEIIPCKQGMTWQWDGVLFEMLSGGDAKTTNDSSCVLKVTANNQSLLLPGDISSTKEMQLSATVDLSSQILLLPHHGSKFSSCEPFLDAVNPNTVVISAGYANRFGHPATETLERLAKFNFLVYNITNTGTVSFQLGGNKSCFELYRNKNKKYWHY